MTASMSGSIPNTTPSSPPSPDRPPSVDLAVVGGGLAGLVAATTAARAGRAVVLFDSRAVGGRARSNDRRGFRFNQGAHALYDAGEARPILLDLGVELTGGPPRVKGGGLWYRDRMHLFPDGPASLMRTSALSPRGKLAAAKLLARAQSIDAGAQRHRTFGDWLDGLRLPTDARDVVMTVVRIATYARSPELMSADAAISQLQRALVGVTYLDGGWQQIVDQLAESARLAGVDIREHSSVRHVGRSRAHDGTGADGWTVDTAAGPVSATNVLLAGMGPHEAARLLGSTADELGWADAGPEVRASCLDLGVSRPADPGVVFAAEQPLYLSTHTPPARLVSDEIAAAGGGVVQLLRYLGADETPDPDVTRRELEEHARRGGLDPSGPADELGTTGGSGVVEQRYLHLMTVAHGTPLAAMGGLPGRPGVTRGRSAGVVRRRRLGRPGGDAGRRGGGQRTGGRRPGRPALGGRATMSAMSGLGGSEVPSAPTAPPGPPVGLSSMSSADAARFEAERARLTGLAYRLLGSVSDAEDVVQDGWLRWQAADRSMIDSPAAWLTTVVSRLGIDRLRARRREQERYIGPWLPEPLVGPLTGGEGPGDARASDPADPDTSSDPAEVAALSDSLTTAFLLMLEELTPTERLTVLLADVFDEPFSSVAEILDKSESAVRQQAVRARRKLRAAAPSGRPTADADQIRTAEAFLAATALGDLDTVMSLLAPDVVMISDGGPDHRAARRPVIGPDRVGRLMVNLAGRIPEGASITLESINGSPGAVVRLDGQVSFVVAVEIAGGLVHGITSVVNPDKLTAVDHPHVIA